MDKLTPYTYYAIVTKVYDGDSITVNVDLGFNTARNKTAVRLNGCNAIELHEPGGQEARDYLASLVPVGSKVMLQSVSYDKYAGRSDAQVWLIDHAGQPLPNGNVTGLMITNGWAVAWNGKGERPVPAWPRVVAA